MMAGRRTLSLPRITLALLLLFSAILLTNCVTSPAPAPTRHRIVPPAPSLAATAALTLPPVAALPTAEVEIADAEVARIVRLSQGQAQPLSGEAFRRRVGRDPKQYPGRYFEIRSRSGEAGSAPLATVRVAPNGTYVYLPSTRRLLEGRSELITVASVEEEGDLIFTQNGRRYRFVGGHWVLSRRSRELAVEVEGETLPLRLVNDSNLQGVESQLTTAEGHDLFVWTLKALAAGIGSDWHTLLQQSIASGRVELKTPALNIVENCLHKDRDFAYPESRLLDFSKGLELYILDNALAAQNREVQNAGVWPWVNTERLPYGTAWSRTEGDTPRLILFADSEEDLDKALLSGWWIMAHLPDVGPGESSMAGNAHRGLFHFGAEAVGDGLFERPLWDWSASPPAGSHFFSDN